MLSSERIPQQEYKFIASEIFDLLLAIRLVEMKREFFGFGGRFPRGNRVCEAIGRIVPSCAGESYSQLSKDRSTPSSKRF
jgi:hypothetical protein